MLSGGGAQPDAFVPSSAFAFAKVDLDPAAGQKLAARRLAEHGVEPRHLRVLRSAAEREAALVEQVRRPLRHQQRPGATERAEAVERELVAALLGLHAAVLRSALDDEATGRG
jgi:hypothetical protein